MATIKGVLYLFQRNVVQALVGKHFKLCVFERLGLDFLIFFETTP